MPISYRLVIRSSLRSAALPALLLALLLALLAIPSRAAAQTSPLPDGTLVGRQRIGSLAGVALDGVVYASSGLLVSGLVCFPDDGLPHPAVIHVRGGVGGIFDGSDGGAMVHTCYEWARDHGLTAFVPSLRGVDGGQGNIEMCLGEVDDVVVGATMLRGLAITDPDRLAILGASLGGCVVLRAAPRIENLRAVVALVPTTAWAELMTYHRTSYQPAVEHRCNGSTRDWTGGGAPFADTLDSFICGHPGCTADDYRARSPMPLVTQQSAPTLIVSGGGDNVVPADQGMLWSIERQSAGHPVDLRIMDHCDPTPTLPTGQDVHLHVTGGFHELPENAIYASLIYLLDLVGRP